MIDDARRMELLAQTLKSFGMFGSGADTLRVAKELMETEQKVSRDFEQRSQQMLDKMDERIKNRSKDTDSLKKGGRNLNIISTPKKTEVAAKIEFEKPKEEIKKADENSTLLEIMQEDAQDVYSDKVEEALTDIKEVDELIESVAEPVEVKEEFVPVEIAEEIEIPQKVERIEIIEEDKPPERKLPEASVDLAAFFNFG